MIRRINFNHTLEHTSGILEVDSNKNGLVVQMKKGNQGDVLQVKKVSLDKNVIALNCPNFSDCTVDNADVLLFGYPDGNTLITQLTLKYEDGNWKILHSM